MMKLGLLLYELDLRSVRKMRCVYKETVQRLTEKVGSRSEVIEHNNWLACEINGEDRT